MSLFPKTRHTEGGTRLGRGREEQERHKRERNWTVFLSNVIVTILL